ncbi:MAG TPA: hypothetical protein VMS98_09895 [Thermoanaerobaculia bacterium]|nr:hypothetical protein [Thermoanaerobaculia bacterium]
MPLVDRSRPDSVTLVSAAKSEMARWTKAGGTGRYTVLRDIEVLENMLRNPGTSARGESVRVVIDGGIDLDRFLLLVATVPENFEGELLYIRRDGSGYLSTRELKNMRTVKTISEMDVEVYLRWHGLPARPRGTYPPEMS